MADNVNDSGPDEIMVRSPKATGEGSEDVEGHRQPLGKDAGPEGAGSKKMPTFDGDEDSDVEGHRQPLGKDAGPQGAGSKKMPTFDGEDDDVEGHGKRLPL